jgi:hypothetical protein
MVLYNCNHCLFSSTIKTHYNRHLKTTKHLKNLKKFSDKSIKVYKTEPQMTTKHQFLTTNDHKRPQKYTKNLDKLKSQNGVKIYTCINCNKELSTKGHLNRHMKLYCPKLKDNNENSILKNLLVEQKKMFEQERKHLYKQIESLIDKVGDTTINNTQTNNIQLNSYGKEDLSHITDSLKAKLIKMPYGMIPKLIEYVHFSETKPENKNIALTNKNDNKIKIFSDNKWVYKNKDETINELMDGKYFILDSFYETCGDKDEDISQNNINTINKYDKFRTFYDEQDKILLDNLKKECELVLLNNR